MTPVVKEEYEVTGIRKKTNAKFFENVAVGDVLIVEVELTTARYATSVKITNAISGEEREDVASRIGSGLRHLKYRRYTE